MRSIVSSLVVVAAIGVPVSALELGAGFGLLSGEVSDPKNDTRRAFRLDAPALTFQLAGGADEGRSIRTSRTARSLRVTLAKGGSFEYDQINGGWKTDDDPDLTYVQIAGAEGMGAWTQVAGLAPLTLAFEFEGQGGYMKIQDGSDAFDATVEEGWLLFPFSATLVADAPLGLSPWASAGYDPITGIASLLYKNVHQAWRWGVGVDWRIQPWLAAEAAWREQTTNISDEAVWAFRTSTLSAGLRVDLDHLP